MVGCVTSNAAASPAPASVLRVSRNPARSDLTTPAYPSQCLHDIMPPVDAASTSAALAAAHGGPRNAANSDIVVSGQPTQPAHAIMMADCAAPINPAPAAALRVSRSTAHQERPHHSCRNALYDAVVARYSSPATGALGRLLLPYLFPELSAFATVEDLVTHLRTSNAHLRTSNARYRGALPAEFLDRNPPPMYITLYFIVTRLPNSFRAVRDHFLALDPTALTIDLLKQHLLAAETRLLVLVGSAATARARVARVVAVAAGVVVRAAVDVVKALEVVALVGVVAGVGALVAAVVAAIGVAVVVGAAKRGGSGGGQRQQQQCRSETPSPQQLREWISQRGASGGSGSCPYVIRTGDRAGQTCGKPHTQHRCFSRLDDAWRAEFGDEAECPRWAELLRSGVAIFDLDYDAILATMYALSVSAEGDCYLCVPPDPYIEAAALGASESALPGTAPAEALHTFTLDSGASRCFFRDSTTLTPLSAPVSARLADPSGDPVLAHSSTVLPCSAVPMRWSLPPLPGGQRVSICTCTWTGRHLATFTHRPGSSLYTLTTGPPQVAASAQVTASGPVAAPCSCRLLLHQTLLWHHRLGHPSMPCLRGMHSRLLVSGLPMSLPPLPPSPAPPCLPCVEGRQRAALHSSSFPPTTSPLQTLHMDVWGPSCNLLVLRLHSDKGGEFSSTLLRDFCRGEGILQSFTLPASPQQNGIAERRIGLVMEVARTSMIHAAAPHFLWPFAVRYAAHQLNLWPRVSLPETLPKLRWTGEVGDASVFRVWGSRAFVPDTSTDKLSTRAIPCVFLGFPPDAPGWQFYHPTSRRVFPSQDVTFDESVPFYRLFPYGSAPHPPPPLFLTPGAARGVASGGAASGGVEPARAEPGGAEPGGAESKGAGSGGAEPGGAERAGEEPGGAEPEGAESTGGAARAGDSAAGDTGAGGVGATHLGGAGFTAGAGGTGRATTAGPGGACTRGTGAAGTGSVGGAGAGGPRAGDFADPGGAGVGGDGAGGTGGGGAGAGGAGAGDIGRRVPHSRPPRVPGTYAMALCPSSVPLRVPLSPPPESSLSAIPDPESDLARAARPTVSRLLATVVTDPSFESTTASALVAELVDFVAACRLDYATALVGESESASPPSVRGECALGTDVLEDRQEDFECLAAAVPHLVAMLLALEGDPDAPDLPTPRSYAKAMTGPYSSQWQTAMDAEMASWKSTGTYVDAFPPSGSNIVDGMWIFRVKRPPGSPPAFKARYVARGFSQRQGVDYFQTFSPTPKMTTLQVLLHVAAQREDEFHSLDFSTVFLQGSLHEEIWLRRPHSFTGSFPAGTQWSLRWPVYGLRQAHREWHETVKTTLAALGFTPSTADPSLFLRSDTSLPSFYVLVYVDDLVFATADTKAPTLVKSELQKRHTCTDLGELRSYPGLQITQDRARRTITLTQSYMVHQVLQHFGFQFSSPQPTPLSTGHSLSAPPSNESVEPSVSPSSGCVASPAPPPPSSPTAAAVAEGGGCVGVYGVVRGGWSVSRARAGGGGSGGSGGSGNGGGGTGARRVGSGGGQRQQQQRRSETHLPQQLREWFLRGASGGSCPYVIRTGVRAGQTCGKLHTKHGCFSRLDDAWHAEFGDDVELPRWADLLRSRIAIFYLDFDAILFAMYALSVSAEGDCYRCVPPDPGIAAAALGAIESGTLLGTTPTQALHTFTLDSGASRCFFRDSTTLTPLPAPIPVRLDDPSGGPVVARSSTVLLCPAIPSGSLSGLHLPSFSTKLVSTAALQDAMVTTTTPRGQRVSICTCTRTGRDLATFTRRPGSSLYTLATEPPQVAASAQVSASGQVAASCLCRLLSHQTLLWHHRLGHPSLPRLRGMHSRLLISGLPRSLPPLPPSPAPPCLLCVKGRHRAAPHSSSLPPTTAPLQTLHMDVWGPARVTRQSRGQYLLLVVDDYTQYTTVFPLRSKGEVVDVLIPWIRTVRLQLHERFAQDLPVLCLHSDRGGDRKPPPCGIESTWIINADQTPLWLEMPANTTVDQTGVRSVPIRSAGYQKERVTMMLACTADGMKLRPWVVFKRKTVPKGNGWMDANGVIQWLEECVKPFLKPGFGRHARSSMVVLDSYRGHLTEGVKEKFRELDCVPAVIPSGCTVEVQPLDVSINKSFKASVRQQYQKWFREVGQEQLTRAGNLKKPPPKVIVRWISRAWKTVPAELIKRAFLTCGISNALDGSEDGLAMAHRRSQLTAEVDVDDSIIADGFFGNNCQEPESDEEEYIF
ncbi:unnamed protein product [Closterium sp. NIES-54]